MYLYLCSQYVYISALFIWSRFFPPQEWMIALVKTHSTEGVEGRHLFREIKSLYGAFPSVVRYTSRFNWILNCSPPTPAPIARIKPTALWLFYHWVTSGSDHLQQLQGRLDKDSQLSVCPPQDWSLRMVNRMFSRQGMFSYLGDKRKVHSLHCKNKDSLDWERPIWNYFIHAQISVEEARIIPIWQHLPK